MERLDPESAATAKALFGRTLRLYLSAWILQRDEPFFQQEAQTAMGAVGEAPSGVPDVLRKFVALGLLSETPDERRVYFMMNHSSPYWEAFRVIGEIFGLLAPQGSASPSRPRNS